MNERTKQLWEESQQWNGSDDGRGGLKILESVEKFAELIVAECISINRQRLFSDYEGDSLRVAHNNALLCANSDMFEHFGVGE